MSATYIKWLKCLKTNIYICRCLKVSVTNSFRFGMGTALSFTC